jgi:prepilin-type processing-associated H-X9-DG protein
VGIIVVLIAILLPVLAKARAAANTARCLANERQLIQAALSYASDNSGYLPYPNWDDDQAQSGSPPITNPQGWLYNPQNPPTTPGAFQPTDLKTGALYTYLNSTDVYRCPQDSNVYSGNTVQLLTDYIMNGAVGDYSNATVEPLRRFKATAAIIWENPSVPIDSGATNDGSNNPSEGIATRHSHGCNVAFVDGHAEQMTWTAFASEWATNAPGFLWCAPKYADGGPAEFTPPITIPTTPPPEPANSN